MKRWDRARFRRFLWRLEMRSEPPSGRLLDPAMRDDDDGERPFRMFRRRLATTADHFFFLALLAACFWAGRFPPFLRTYPSISARAMT